mmetsp:Transcript_36684/g.105122  ORF Transcript_36684/g.105122 Transcript_36684/m.105122 type:complete len:82 (+) Transcript_36684:552-797(+)
MSRHRQHSTLLSGSVGYFAVTREIGRQPVGSVTRVATLAGWMDGCGVGVSAATIRVMTVIIIIITTMVREAWRRSYFVSIS